MNDLREKIYGCACDRCSALERLIEEKGAVLQFREDAAGRLCELAVIAASGESGMLSDDVVAARRDYAKHLGLKLTGPISDSDEPVHIRHAITNSNHNPSASSRINLGEARASLVERVFRLA